MTAIDDKINEEYRKSVYLKGVQFDCRSYEQSRKIKEAQDKAYKKTLFFKELKKAMKKEGM